MGGGRISKQTAYGFLTRGCPRSCAFCHVVPKEGRCSTKVADLNQFWSGQGNIVLSDPNILACKDREDLLSQLVASNARIEFNQGLDARLIDDKTAKLLARMKIRLPHFAMDTMKDMHKVACGIGKYVAACKEINGKWNWRNAKVFVLTNFDTTHDDDMKRIHLIQDLECWPYVMIYNKYTAPQITRRLQRWTNSAAIYASFKDFDEYQRTTYKKPPKDVGNRKRNLTHN